MADDLYKEVPCRQCGQMKLEIATFCSHCGHVVKETWIEKITNSFRPSQDTTVAGRSRRNPVPLLMGILIAGYFFYTAIERESLQGLILGILSLVFALRSYFQGSAHPQSTQSTDKASLRDDQNAEEDLSADKFFCENCGTKVPGDATECPKCGMKFG